MPHARSPTLRRSPECGPDATRGAVAWVSVPPARPIGPRRHRPPTGPAVLTAHAARQRGGGHAAAHRSVLARSVIALYTRATPIQFPIRFNFLSDTPPHAHPIPCDEPQGTSRCLRREQSDRSPEARHRRLNRLVGRAQQDDTR